MGLFMQLLSLNRPARRLLTIFLKNSGKERIIQRVRKERCIKEHIVFEPLYVSCICLTS